MVIKFIEYCCKVGIISRVHMYCKSFIECSRKYWYRWIEVRQFRCCERIKHTNTKVTNRFHIDNKIHAARARYSVCDQRQQQRLRPTASNDKQSEKRKENHTILRFSVSCILNVSIVSRIIKRLVHVHFLSFYIFSVLRCFLSSCVVIIICNQFFFLFDGKKTTQINK